MLFLGVVNNAQRLFLEGPEPPITSTTLPRNAENARKKEGRPFMPDANVDG